MDVLSEVLRVVKLEAALFFNGEFSAPWCLRSSPAAAMMPYVSASAGHRLIIYHFLTEGRAYARLPDGPRVELTAGDIVVFPQGQEHLLGNGSPAKPVDSLKTFGKNLAQGLKLARMGGGGEVTRFVCGFMACDPRLGDVFLSGLPQIVKVHVSTEPSGQWLANSIRFSVNDDAPASNAGSAAVVSRLSELLFVETLRRYINSLPPDRTGWLAGARDPAVGHALTLLHKDPARDWTVASLARTAGLSRTRLAERFRHFLGESPMAYLTRWRMKLSADLLHSTEHSVAEIAANVGYASEASFNRAFKREFASPPAAFRRRGKTHAFAIASPPRKRRSR
jgi:AraC-like DNA-binding protein